MPDRSQRLAARIFAVATLLSLVIIMVAFTRWYAAYLVWEHNAETARNFAAHDPLVHFYIAAAMVYGIGMVVLPAALYVVFRPIGRGLALFAALAKMVYVAMWFIGLLDLFSALRMMKGGAWLQAFDAGRLQALAGIQLASGWDAYYIGLTFYAIGSFLFSLLFFQSRYVPSALAIYGMLSTLFEAICAFAYLNDRGFGAIVSPNWYELPVTFFEVIISLWILVRGLRPLSTAGAIQATN